MKLATLKEVTPKGRSRDGSLAVVNSTLTLALPIPHISKTLQGLLDDWSHLAPLAHEAFQALEHGNAGGAIPFDETQCESPLPRAYQWVDGSAYLNHVELVRKARGAEMPQSFLTDPLMYQGGSDCFLAPREDISFSSEQYGIDMEAEVAVILDDTPMEATLEEAYAAIRLIVLVNDVSLRGLIPNELQKGFGFFHGKPSSAFSPVAVTPDELHSAWRNGKVCLPLLTTLNGKIIGHPNAGADMNFSFPDLIVHASKTRNLRAGTIVGSGTVSNRDASLGVSCLAEKRMIETLENGEPITPFMKFGDRVRIEMLDEDGNTVFGAIDQTVVEYNKPALAPPQSC